LAGGSAVRAAIADAGRSDPCDIVLLFCTARHDQAVLRAAAAAAAGDAARIYGGGAVGVITGDWFGYAGDQAGAACIWLDGVGCEVFVDDGLLDSEEDTGRRLGERLRAHGVGPDSPVMLFYDAVDRSTGGVRLLMATWLLAGLEEGLGFLPDLTGAGMQGDHVCTPTGQFIGDSIGRHCAMALAFSGVRIDSAIMHGCRPASPYYTVTKADGPVILEIDGRPAIEFMDSLLGPEITPEQYPFFLIFGIDHGEPWAEYDEDNYASRLCLGLDRERGGIVMFEPDMEAGAEFRLMFRSLDLEYMRPKIEALFDRLDGREPLFAMYIDCAGRCAGYGGADIEDAYVVQRAVAGRAPLLGIYTGVEIASIGGRPRGLDWTGVFCLFSREREGEANERPAQMRREKIWSRAPAPGARQSASLQAALRLNEQTTAKVLALDAQTIAIRHELEQKRRGFQLLAELSVSLRQEGYDGALAAAARRMNAALNMQRTAVLTPDARGGFTPAILQGYGEEEKARLAGRRIEVPAELLIPEKPALVTGADDSGRFAELREALDLPYLISAPIVVKDRIAGLLITGRRVEQVPFLSRLNRGDAETVQAIGALLASLIVYRQLDEATQKAQTDPLTGLYNREMLESRAAWILSQCAATGQQHALLIIDFDNFKQVNDTHGHQRGDEALRALARALRGCFRSSDVIARIGGDEFAVLCTGISGVAQISAIVTRLIDGWRAVSLPAAAGGAYRATVSVGLALAPRDAATYPDLFRKADLALYRSKEQGRDRYTIYDAETMEDEG
jgi:diguanylate cyclase (GGDEF)-like protein